MKYRVRWLPNSPLRFYTFIIISGQYRPKIFKFLHCFRFTPPCIDVWCLAFNCFIIFFFPELPAVLLIHLILLSPFVLPPLLVMSLPECQCCQLVQLTVTISDINIYRYAVLQVTAKGNALTEIKHSIKAETCVFYKNLG
jgi:hypothetical protein